MSETSGALRDGRVWLGVAGAGLAAALIVPSGPPGAGLLLVGLAITAAVGAGRPRPLDLESGGFTAAALLLLAMAAVFDAPWLVLVDLLAATGCAAVAVTGAETWAAALAAPFRVAAQALRVPRAVAGAIPRPRGRVDAGAVARTSAVSVVLLVTFGALFTSADAAFARIAGDVLLPDIAPGVLPARVLAGVLTLMGAGGLLLVGRAAPAGGSGPFGDPWRASRLTVSTIEWAVPLALLNGLFAAFVLVQIAVLFGGHDHVLETTGLTYAQYARAGFFQLVVIAALVLGVIAFASRVAGDRARPLLRVLLGTLCALTLVVLASALRRMDLYEAVYGLTRIRVAVYAVDLWLAGVFALVMLAGLRERAPWLPRAVIAFSVAALLAFNVSNPDGRIARSAVERWEATGSIDRHYLSTLSADGLPALLELPDEVGRCIVGPIAARTQRISGAWTSFNLSRARALDLITAKENGCTYY